jgi:hypothetical protein
MASKPPAEIRAYLDARHDKRFGAAARYRFRLLRQEISRQHGLYETTLHTLVQSACDFMCASERLDQEREEEDWRHV